MQPLAPHTSRSRVARRLPALLALAAALAAGVAAGPAAHAAERLRPVATTVPLLDHIIVIVEENHSYDQVRTQPYTASLIAAGSSFSNSYAVTHPSQPNYLALWSGSTQGVTSNVCPPPGSPYLTENLGHACEVAGITWRSYAERLPFAGSDICDADSQLYARKHCPWTHFGNLTHLNERPFGDLATDIANHTLPRLAFVVPDQCNDSHNGGACSVALADSWLAAQVPAMLDAVGPNGVVIVTWDEDDNYAGNHILTVVNGAPVIANYISTRYLTHYTLLRTITDALGLAPFAAAVNETPATDIWVPSGPTAIGLPGPNALDSPAPNPSRGVVHCALTVPAGWPLEVSVLDVAGHVVRRWTQRSIEPRTALAWDGRDAHARPVAAGVYRLRVRAAGATWERRLLRLP